MFVVPGQMLPADTARTLDNVLRGENRFYHYEKYDPGFPDLHPQEQPSGDFTEIVKRMADSMLHLANASEEAFVHGHAVNRQVAFTKHVQITEGGYCFVVPNWRPNETAVSFLRHNTLLALVLSHELGRRATAQLSVLLSVASSYSTARAIQDGLVLCHIYSNGRTYTEVLAPEEPDGGFYSKILGLDSRHGRPPLNYTVTPVPLGVAVGTKTANQLASHLYWLARYFSALARSLS